MCLSLGTIKQNKNNSDLKGVANGPSKTIGLTDSKIFSEFHGSLFQQLCGSRSLNFYQGLESRNKPIRLVIF